MPGTYYSAIPIMQDTEFTDNKGFFQTFMDPRVNNEISSCDAVHMS